MPELFIKAFSRLSEFFNSLNPAKKAATAAIAIGVIISIPMLFMWASRTTYTTLMTNLSPEDSTSIIRYLREKHIPFIVDEAGRTLSVPPEKVYDLRLELASSGLAQSGVVGYEVFDKQSFGAASTVQRINEQRALEGELIRTIDHIHGIERSRVHLAIPQKSAFLEEEKKPTASVILDLVPGFNPTDDQVHGIQRLVSAAVKGLDMNSVIIISNSGKQLSQNTDDPAAAFAAAALDYQRKFEQRLEGRVQSLLSTVVGEGKVIAKINADFDFSRVSETKTLFDGENAVVRTTNKDSDTMQGNRPLPSGQPGVRSQVPGAENQVATPLSATNSTQRNNETSTYEIPKTTISTEKPMASLKRLSVAVMVDAPSVADPKAPGGMKSTPVSEEQLSQFRSIIANAVGWDKDRDPAIEVKSIAFFHEDLDAAAAAVQKADRSKLIGSIVQWIAIGLIFSLFFLFVVRPFIKWVTENTVDSVEDFLPQTLEELEKVQAKQVAQSLEDILPEIEEKVDPEKVQSEMLKEKVMSLVNDNPHKASQILHEWISEKPVEKKDDKESA